MRTAELRAYNFGGRVRAAGLDLAALQYPGMAWAAVPFTATEEAAEEVLGPEAFQRWAVRGWLDQGSENDVSGL